MNHCLKYLEVFLQFSPIHLGDSVIGQERLPRSINVWDDMQQCRLMK